MPAVTWQVTAHHVEPAGCGPPLASDALSIWLSRGGWRWHRFCHRCQSSPASSPVKLEGEQSPYLQRCWGSTAKRIPRKGVSWLCASSRATCLGSFSEGKSCSTLSCSGTCRQEWPRELWLLRCPATAGLLHHPTWRLQVANTQQRLYQHLSWNISEGRGFLMSHAHRSCPICRKLPRGGIVKTLSEKERNNETWIRYKSLER